MVWESKFFQKQIDYNWTPIPYLGENIALSVVASEDSSFCDHIGIDINEIYKVIRGGEKRGASTITQQLAKNLFNDGGSSNTLERLIQKVKEWIVAVKLERQYTKNEIIAMYLNTQGFLFNAIGIRSASRIYFGKEPKDLDIQESAILVAMLKNPRQFNPNREISKKS